MVAVVGLLSFGCGDDDVAVLNNVAPAAQFKEFVVIPNATGASANTIVVRSINQSNGSTVQVASAATGTTPTMVACHRSTNLIYVSNFNSNNISAFRVDTNGGLSSVAGSPFTGPNGGGARNIHISPNGQFVYVCGSTNMQAYTIQADGTLVANGAAVPMVSGPRNDGVFSNNGSFLHVPVVNGVQTFALNTNTGVATANGNNVIGGISLVNDVSISPAGVLLATCQIAGANNDTVVPFTVSNTGVLTAGATQNVGFDIGMGEVSAEGVFYVGELVNAQIRAFTVNNAGVLTALANSPFSSPGGSGQVRLDPSGKLVFSAPFGVGSLATNVRQSDSSLVPGTGSPFTDNLSDPFVYDFFRVDFQP